MQLNLPIVWYNDVLDHKWLFKFEFLRLKRPLLCYVIRGKTNTLPVNRSVFQSFLNYSTCVRGCRNNNCIILTNFTASSFISWSTFTCIRVTLGQTGSSVPTWVVITWLGCYNMQTNTNLTTSYLSTIISIIWLLKVSLLVSYTMGDFWDAWWQQTYQVKFIVLACSELRKPIQNYLVGLLTPSLPKSPIKTNGSWNWNSEPLINKQW